MHKLKRGILISFEGIDGAGKSTLAKLLSDYLTNDLIDHITTKEPGGSLLGQQLRNMLHKNTVSMCPKAEFLLFAADRAQHMHDVVLPALAQHTLVISDRMADSSLAYQGYGRGVDKEMIQAVNAWTMNRREPDLIFFIHIPIENALNRISKRGSTSQFEQHASFLEQVEKGFHALFSNRKNVVYVDGTPNTEIVASTLYNHLKDWICKNQLQ